MRLPLLLSLLCSVFLTSCIVNEEVEKLGLINTRGIDLIDEDVLDIHLVTFRFSNQIDNFVTVLNGRGDTVKGATDNAEQVSLFKLAPGKMKLTLYGKDLAEQGLLRVLDTEVRDARIPDLMYLSVSRTTAKELLTLNDSDFTTDVGQLLYGLIENHSTDHNIPRKTLQDFLRIYYDIGQDNALPLFEIDNGKPRLDAVGVFDDDKLVGEITINDAVLVNLMSRTVKERIIELSLPIDPFNEFITEHNSLEKNDRINLAFLITNGKSKTKLTSLDELTFQTNTKIELRLLEQSAGMLLEDYDSIKLMEKEIKKELEKNLHSLLKQLQEFNSDIFGYGKYYKKTKKGKDLTREEWREKFPEIDVTFNIDVDIIRHGVID